MRWRTHARKRDNAYPKYLEGNVFRETYPDLWHVDSISETLPTATRNGWVAGIVTGLQDTDNPVGMGLLPDT